MNLNSLTLRSIDEVSRDKISHFNEAYTYWIVIYVDFHSTKWAPWLVDSWSRATNQIQMYPDQDTIAQLLPARRLCLFAFAVWLFKAKSKYITKHLMYSPSGNQLIFLSVESRCFPRLRLGKHRSLRKTKLTVSFGTIHQVYIEL